MIPKPYKWSLGRPALDTFERSAEHEWLVTNGIGGFASGTVAGACTRRYHGLLVAALRPPVGRTVLVAKLDLRADYLGRNYGLASNEYADGTVNPHGYRYLETFELDGLVPTWTFCLADGRLRQRIWMAHGENTTYLTLSFERGSNDLELELTPLCSYRDYHAHSRGGWALKVSPRDDGCEVAAFDGATPYYLRCDRGRFEAAPEWHWNVKHRAETARGLDDIEDLWRPGTFRVRLAPGSEVALSLSIHAAASPRRARQELIRERRRQARLIADLRVDIPDWVRQLSLAADQFVVARSTNGETGATVIAGYPWFSDWGRDTMIALPGLTLSTGRLDVAREIVRTFGRYVSEGMLPNRFSDAGEAPEYNTVDATLWYFHAIDLYLHASVDLKTVGELYPVLDSIIDWHTRGTRYGIRIDPEDGLLHAGEAGVQLTWMDAKVGDWVVTPRIGKPVEINALWHRALKVMAAFAQALDKPADAAGYARRADQAAQSFRNRFWYAEGGYLFDVIDGPAGDDPSLRPNQIFAVSLDPGLLEPEHARAVVNVCARELWTPYGLRSLARSDPAYAGRYRGGPGERDAVYHQGTVWGWLLGPFAEAHFAVHGDATTALSFLEPIESHLRDACIGSISEIFDGDEPNHAAGCFAQAWSVSEVLRAWLAISAQKQSIATHQTKAKTL
jgi:predicted glycogen debranching enzyme